ncbi:MAG: MOSC N-terminal beta barrel domain-containing protein [Methyloceanibacter sp.]
MELAEIHCYPVKSLRGAARKAAKVELIGLEGDRRFLVVDGSGRFQTIQEFPKMVQIEAQTSADGIFLRHEDAGACFVSTPRHGAPEETVTIWEDSVRAVAAGDEADAFLSRVLGTPLRLVYLANPMGRRVETLINAGGDHVSFADVTPILLTSTSSLADLSERVGTFIAMRRFRPSLVVSGAAPFAEDTWREIRIGAVRFRVAKPCKRCAITTRDPDTGEQIDPYEPLRTLMRFHRGRDGGAMFGQYLIPDNEGTVGIGDEVEVLSAGASNVM